MPSPRPFRLQMVSGIVIFFAVLTSCLTAWAADYASVSKDGVNIRAGASTKDEILWEVFKDFPLEVIKRQGQWTQIKDFESDTGWIFSPLLSKKKTVIVKVKTANMRVGPGQDYEIVATVKYGVVFNFAKREGEWLQLKHEDGTEGWIFSNLVWPAAP